MDEVTGEDAGADTLEVLVAADDVDEESEAGGDKGLWRRRDDDGGTPLVRRTLRTADLSAGLNRTLTSLNEVFSSLSAAGPQGWSVSQVEVTCAITATGGFAVVGLAGQVQRAGGVTLTLTRTPEEGTPDQHGENGDQGGAGTDPTGEGGADPTGEGA